MVKSIQQLSVDQLYPEIPGEINLNTCGDPDCGNFGVAPWDAHSAFRGRNAAQKRLAASVSNAAISAGVGRYKLGTPGNKDLERVSDAIEYDGDPHAWSDGRILKCLHGRRNGVCDVQFQVMSNAHLEDEIARLKSQNDVLRGPICGACGTPYLEKPEEFAFNGANGKAKAKPLGIRLIHKPCRAQKGARFTVSVDHRRQKDRSDNIRILSQLVNEAGINALRRLLEPPRGASQVGIQRIYDRIFWLERVLLAYERAQLGKWQKRLRNENRMRHNRIAHDDIVLGVNWETSADRRITALNCAVSADIQSGYVFRIDVDFDPTVDPVSCLEAAYLDPATQGTTLRKRYQQASGVSFTAPLLSFQRPTGRFDEPALFSSAVSHLRLFAVKTEDAMARSIATTVPAVQREIDDARLKADALELLGERYFNFGASERESRNAFTGIMTRDSYTKAAHLACLKAMLPDGRITLVGEQEAAMARVVPHIFREEITADRFEWHVIHFDKTATKPEILRRTGKFDAAFRAFRNANPHMTPPEALQVWVQARLTPAVRTTRSGRPRPFPISNFASRAWPALWLHGPIQAAGETDKVVGFPILSARYRGDYRALNYQTPIQNPDLQAAIARRVINATVQPAATFMNALRERVSFAQRAGGRASRTGGDSFVNGACYNPRVLIALLNIYRVHYNFFEARQYVSPINKHDETEYVSDGTTTIAVPGSRVRIKVPKRRRLAPVKRTPAMRAGIHHVPAAESQPKLPDLSRLLYLPWLFYGTPLWAKLQGR